MTIRCIAILCANNPYLKSLWNIFCLSPQIFCFCRRIREVADKINKYGSQTPQILQSLKAPVKQMVIGPAHIGILLEDGRVLRVAYSVIPERLDLSKQEPNKS